MKNTSTGSAPITPLSNVGDSPSTTTAIEPAPVQPAVDAAPVVKTEDLPPVQPPPPLRTDGPTLAEYIAAGYQAENYPPQGYAVREDPQPPPPPTAAELLQQAEARVKQRHELLQSALTRVREALAFALRVMINNGVFENEQSRLITEDAFEAAKNASAGGKGTREDLYAAIAGLQVAGRFLSNRSLKSQGDLQYVLDEIHAAEHNKAEILNLG